MNFIHARTHHALEHLHNHTNKPNLNLRLSAKSAGNAFVWGNVQEENINLASETHAKMYTLFTQVIKSLITISENDLQEILSKCRFRQVPKNFLLVEQGKTCKEIFFINSGMIRTLVNHDGIEITNWVALPGTIETSAQSFIKKIPSPFSLQALTDIEVLVISRDNYYHLLNHNHAFNELAFKMMEDFYLRMEDKFYSYLFLSAEARFLKMKKQFPYHFKQVPLKYLASILRIQPATLSRLRKKLK